MNLTSKLHISVATVSIFGVLLLRAATVSNDSQSEADSGWSQLIASMDKMHMNIGSGKTFPGITISIL